MSAAPSATPDAVEVRIQGLKLLTPLRPLIAALSVTDADSYLEADGLLGRVKHARATWVAKFGPILQPLKAAEKNIKQALRGAKDLDAEVDGPLEQMELSIKEAMRQYKLKEQLQLQEAEEERRRKVEAMRLEAEEKERKALLAKTPQMKAKLAQSRQDLLIAAELVEDEPVTPIRGAASTSRSVRKWRVKDMKALLRGVLSGEVPADVIVTADPVIGRYWSSDRAIVEAWPGMEGFDDVIIARR